MCIIFFKVDVNDVWRLPSNVDPKDAAVLICGHSTALYTFSKLCELNKDDKIVISAGAAGLGLAAIDVAANAYKARVNKLIVFMWFQYKYFAR